MNKINTALLKHAGMYNPLNNFLAFQQSYLFVFLRYLYFLLFYEKQKVIFTIHLYFAAF